MLLIYNPDLSPAMLKTLKRLNRHILPSLRLSALPKGVAAHPDMQIHAPDPHVAVCAPECYAYYRENLPQEITLLKGVTPLSGTYPGDAAYNAACIGEYVFCNPKHIDPILLSEYQKRKKHILPVKQGYTKCNLCPVTNQLVLTEDSGIHHSITVNQSDIRSVLLPKGEILLQGYPYGFIGGASGLVNRTIIWYGSPRHCSYFGQIEALLQCNRVTSAALSDENLCDLGGIISLMT